MKIACASINTKIADCKHNCQQIIEAIKTATEKNVDFLLFGELSVTGSSCGDLFYNNDLLASARSSLYKVVEATSCTDMVVIVGAPIEICDKLFNCAVIIQSNRILGVVPKTIIPNSNEQRYFSSSKNLTLSVIELLGQNIPIGQPMILCDSKNHVSFGVEIGDDLISPIPMSSKLCLHDAQIIFNLSADMETVSKIKSRRELIKQVSTLQKSIYVYCSGGKGESTTDVIYSEYMGIYHNGQVVSESDSLFDDSFVVADVDTQECIALRKKMNVFTTRHNDNSVITIPFNKKELCDEFGKHMLVREPFFQYTDKVKACEWICQMQQKALLKRMEYMNRNKLIIGVSGGLDSTVALLACVRLFKAHDMPLENIIGVTMPGAGTSERTLTNAVELMKELGITRRNIPITKAVKEHLENISHPEGVYDITYEQTQSRERTKILMDIANQQNGIVIGTGDMSEFALGWMSYSGDHISMYAINCGLPKTVIRKLIKWYIDSSIGRLSHILQDISDTPISPELLPLDDNGQQIQRTETLVGSYILHDFFLYHLIINNMAIRKLFKLSCNTFSEYNPKEIKRLMKVFITRFFTRQFKRSCFSDGIQLLDAGLSPRGYLRMPSDAECTLWINELEEIRI